MSSPLGSDHEQGFVRAFIRKNRQERSLALLSSAKRRRDFTKELAHLGWLDECYSSHIPANIAHTSAEIVTLLLRKSASANVWIISEDQTIDGQQMEIEQAMDHVWGSSFGSVLSCIPGRLAFFHGEAMKSERLLERS